MVARLRTPGGRLGTWTVALAAVLAALGVVGAVTMLVSLAADATFWSDNDSDQVIALVLFLLGVLGAIGFVIQDRNPAGGAALAVLGGLAIGLVLFWAVLPLVAGLAAAVVAVLRARALGARPATA